MTTVITSGDFSVDPVNLARLCQAAPDIRSVLAVNTVNDMCVAAARMPKPVVGVIGGDRSPAVMAGIVRKFGAADGNGLLVAAPSAAREVIAAALLQGVRGWVLTESPVEELITAIRAVAAGHVFLPSARLHELADIVLVLTCQTGAAQAQDELTNRELGVLRLLAHGAPNSEIAAQLVISEATVHSHVLSILRKMKARNRTEAVAMVYRRGIVLDRGAVPA